MIEFVLNGEKRRIEPRLGESLLDALRERFGALSLKDAGRLIDHMGRKEAQRAMGVALRYFFPELEPAETKSPDPPSPAASQ